MARAREQDERRTNFRVGLIVSAGAALLLTGTALWSVERVDDARSKCLEMMHRGLGNSDPVWLDESAQCFDRLARARPVRSARNLFRAEVARTLLPEAGVEEISRWPREAKPGIDALASQEYGLAANEFAAAVSAGGSSAGVARRFERLSRELAEKYPAN